MTNTDQTTRVHKLVFAVRAAHAAGKPIAASQNREQLAALIVGVFTTVAAKACGQRKVNPQEIDAGMTCAKYVDDLIAGTTPLPECVEAVLSTMAKRKAVDHIRRARKHQDRQAARFTDSGKCTPVGSAGEMVDTRSIVAATTTASPEEQVVARMMLRDSAKAMTRKQQLVVFGPAVGLSTAEVCATLGCSSNSLYVMRHRALGQIDAVALGEVA